jgi:predicted ferric reductase
MLCAVQVQGPFYAPAKMATHFSTHATVLVASGIGITPFFSVMATKVADELSYEVCMYHNNRHNDTQLYTIIHNYTD